MIDQRQPQDNGAEAPANISHREGLPRLSAVDRKLVATLLCFAVAYWLVSSASSSLDQAVEAERTVKAEESRKSNPWAKD